MELATSSANLFNVRLAWRNPVMHLKATTPPLSDRTVHVCQGLYGTSRSIAWPRENGAVWRAAHARGVHEGRDAAQRFLSAMKSILRGSRDGLIADLEEQKREAAQDEAARTEA